jgi:protein-tyrosine phosphatase
MGIDEIVSALTEEECAELDLLQEKEYCEKAGINYVAFPIGDRGVPASSKATLELVHRLERSLALGKNIAIHCRQGVGRAAMLAACVLAVSGVAAATAFDRIAVARGCGVPDTNEQREWVLRFASEMLASLARSSPAVEEISIADGTERFGAELHELGVDPESL